MDYATLTDAELVAQIAAEDAQFAAAEQVRTDEAAYYALVAELEQAEATLEARGVHPTFGVYLTDTNIDSENAGVPREHPEFWARCLGAAKSAAGGRAEEYGADINELVGRVIY